MAPGGRLRQLWGGAVDGRAARRNRRGSHRRNPWVRGGPVGSDSAVPSVNPPLPQVPTKDIFMNACPVSRFQDRVWARQLPRRPVRNSRFLACTAFIPPS
ncbi:hypothetical protein GCM10020295_08810 [Streptomyces cinereospinus]